MTVPVRAVAASLLDDVAQGSSLNKIYARAERTVAESEQPFLRELVYGSLRLWPLYKGVTRQLLERPLKAKDSVLEACSSWRCTSLMNAQRQTMHLCRGLSTAVSNLGGPGLTVSSMAVSGVISVTKKHYSNRWGVVSVLPCPGGSTNCYRSPIRNSWLN